MKRTAPKLVGKKPLRKSSKRRRSKPESSRLIDKLWKLFSVFIRQRDEGICFTCGQWNYWKDTDAGHFISRRVKSVLFDPMNVHAQCRKCNRFLYGNVAEYSARLIDMYGPEEFKKLMDISHREKRWTEQELKKLIEAIKFGTFEEEYAKIRATI